MKNGYDNNNAKLGVEQSGRMREDSDSRAVRQMGARQVQTTPQSAMIKGNNLKFLGRGDQDY
jgi:hypothetical protein